MQSNEPMAQWWVVTFGWFIFPVWGIDENTLQCMCGDPECKRPGKHPHSLAPNGHNSASNNPAQVQAWWNIAPYANIGVDTGRSNLAVLDSDGSEGVTDLFNMLASIGIDELPLTLRTRTGSGGEHLFFDATGYDIKSMNRYFENNDVKAKGGYVILPTSLHHTGNRYEILDNAYPAPLPDLLAQRLLTAKSGAAFESSRKPGEPSYDFSEACKYGAAAGYRDDFFNRFAFKLKKDGRNEEYAFNEVKRVWELTEQPQNDQFTFQQAVEKLIRVYRDDSVQADEIPEWPAGLAAPVATESIAEPIGMPTTSSSLLEIMGMAPRSDVGNGNLLAWHINTRWVFTNKDWYEYINGLWTQDVTNRIEQEATLMAKLLLAFSYDNKNDLENEDRKSLVTWALQTHFRVRMQAMIKQASSDPKIACNIELFDQDPYILTANNVTINLRTGEGYEHRPEDMCMKGTKVDYVPGFQSPLFTKYINATCASDPSELLYLQRLSGSMLCGETLDKSLYMAIGPKNTGKTTFINLLLTVLNSYAMSIDPKYLMKRRMQTIPPHERANMENKRVVVSDEPAIGDFFDESLLKTMTGRGTITADKKFKDSRTFQTRFTLFIAGNQAPAVHDEALKARIVEIPFDHELSYEDQNPEISRAATDPTSDFCKAALAWMVAGCVDWCAHGLAERPVRVVLATEAYLMDQDVLGEFIEECLIYELGARVTVQAAYNVYAPWTKSHNEYVLTKKQFTTDMKMRGGGISVISGSGRHGLCVKDYKINESVLAWPGQNV